MYELALFAGAGGGLLGAILRSHTIIGAVEIESYPREVLLARQKDGILPAFPVWDDVRTFRLDNLECAEYIELLRTVRDNLVISGGFPCQDISTAGKGAGLAGNRSGLWNEMARIIGEIRPRFAFVENSPMLAIRGGVRVAADLAKMGYDARWGALGGFAAGGCSNGERLWFITNEADSKRQYQIQIPSAVVNPEKSSRRQFERAISACSSAEAHARMLRNPDGLAREMDRLAAIGNGQDPAVVDLAWEILGQQNKDSK